MDLRHTPLYAAYTDFLFETRGRRSHPTTMRIGRLGGPHRAIPHDEFLGPGLRADVVERALDALNPAKAVPWITRGGLLSPGDADFAWFAASREAFGRHGYPVPSFYVVTREGWLNLLDEETGLWRGRRST